MYNVNVCRFGSNSRSVLYDLCLDLNISAKSSVSSSAMPERDQLPNNTHSPTKHGLTHYTQTMQLETVKGIVTPIFKKDGRTWLHKSSATSKYGLNNVIAHRFKKDSRVWLHKSSRKRKLFAVLNNILCELEINVNSPSLKGYANMDWKAGDRPVFAVSRKHSVLPTQNDNVSLTDVMPRNQDLSIRSRWRKSNLTQLKTFR